MKLLISGSRDFKNKALMYEQLVKFKSDTVLVHGACDGADMMSDEIGRLLGFTIKDYPVSKEEWRIIGPSAGPKRNRLMLDSENPDLVLAFHIEKSLGKGTANLVQEAIKRHIPYFCFISIKDCQDLHL